MKEAKHKRLYIIRFCLYEVSRKGRYIEMKRTLVVAWGGGMEVKDQYIRRILLG